MRVLLCCVAVASMPVGAAEPFSQHVARGQAAVALPVGAPTDQRFGAGASLSAGYEWRFFRFLGLDVGLTGLWVGLRDGGGFGSLVAPAVGVRGHVLSLERFELSAAARGVAALTGLQTVARPAFDVDALGELKLGRLWAGAFVRYVHVLQTAPEQFGLGAGDGRFLQLGLSLRFDVTEPAGDPLAPRAAAPPPSAVPEKPAAPAAPPKPAAPKLTLRARPPPPPPPDADHDGVPDAKDRCPTVPEDLDGEQDTDGCPDLDNDRDGVQDDVDLCPDAAEDRDGVDDKDGCPDPDNDQDGVVDGKDKCPRVAEDEDGFEDADGCPDPDNDKDGVPDEEDACPSLAGKLRGCPVPVVVIGDELKVLTPLEFTGGTATLTPPSLKTLESVRLVLGSQPELLKVEIQGHTEDVGDAAANRALSLQRAEAVKAWLVEHGIAAGRLEAVGYGADQPLVREVDAASRAVNRRIQLLVVKRGRTP